MRRTSPTLFWAIVALVSAAVLANRIVEIFHQPTPMPWGYLGFMSIILAVCMHIVARRLTGATLK